MITLIILDASDSRRALVTLSGTPAVISMRIVEVLLGSGTASSMNTALAPQKQLV